MIEITYEQLAICFVLCFSGGAIFAGVVIALILKSQKRILGLEE